ncbi:MAG: bifunctional serine/threonine-protein kinase/formylglycine-generating enzyme family protein [Pseudomonadota bacterium]
MKILSTRNPLDQQEIANHSKLNDSGLAPKILDRLTEYNFCFIEMEYIKALSLKQYMEREGDLHPDEAMKIMSQVCETIHEIHQRDIIHRDLKPSHILLNPTGETGSRKFPVILDFGISLDVKSRQDPVWKDTWPYTAPEILRERIHDHRVDVFSLGVIFKEVLGWTGQAPPPADLDRKLRDICRKAVAEDPAQRFASARDFAKAITAFREAPSVEIGKGGERRARMRHIHAGNRTVQNCTLRDFLVDPFPVTAREFLKFADSGYLDPASESVRPRRMRRIWTQTGLKWLQEHSSFRERRPALDEDPDEWAHSISWVEAAAFCNWLTIRESCPDFLDGPAGNEERFKKSLGLLYYRERSPWSGQRPGGYRLPMEFELVCAEKEINAPEDGHELTTDCFLGKPHLEGYAQRSNPVVFVDFGHSKTLVRLGNHRDRTSASPRSVPHIRTHFRCARTAK